MNKSFLKSKSSLSLIPAALLGVAWLSTCTASAGGTDVLHLSLTKTMVSGAIAPTAAGDLAVKCRKQGHSEVQSLELRVSSLDISAAYLLMVPGPDENTPLVQVGAFETDATGAATLKFRSVATGKGKAHKTGKGWLSLPQGLNPLWSVQTLVVAQPITLEPVLTADFETPEELRYLLKQNLSEAPIRATLQVNSTGENGDLRLVASHLVPASAYQLVLDTEVVQEVVADSKGKLDARFTLENPMELLGLDVFELRDATGTALIESALP